MENKLKLLVDFDETINAYSEGKGRLMERTKEALEILTDLGFELVIYTARLSTPENKEFHQKQIETIINYVLCYDLPIKSITGRKLHAWGYIDDRAFRFKGNWEETVKEVKEQLIKEGKIG